MKYQTIAANILNAKSQLLIWWLSWTKPYSCSFWPGVSKENLFFTPMIKIGILKSVKLAWQYLVEDDQRLTFLYWQLDRVWKVLRKHPHLGLGCFPWIFNAFLRYQYEIYTILNQVNTLAGPAWSPTFLLGLCTLLCSEPCTGSCGRN